MATLLGWKDILRPIRDGYRHYFPVPDSGPTPEERHKQRNLDQLKGFTYFDTFEQLDTWSEAESSPIQRANTPLLRRHLTDTEDHLDKAAILLVHDYAGNYHDYECIRNIGVGAELYACEYLQYVDTFVYFSHKLLCVPPPTWINALHRNGVRALGTLLIEPQTEGSERLLQHTVGINGLVFPAVKKLIRIAEHYGFDGWLVNIEKPFPKADWDLNILLDFLRQLKGELKEDMRLIWFVA
jgi:endo-beta-N-acetylglucosaminidase D